MEHLTEKQVEDYSLRQLPAADLLALSDHLAECETCRRRVEGVNDVAVLALYEETLAEGLADSAHLSTEQTADYVDKNLSRDALQVVNDHLTTCERCVLAVKDLRAFRNEIAPSLDRHFGPTSIPTPAGDGWRRKFVSLFKVAPVPAFASAALAVLLLTAIAWLAWRTPREEKQEVVVAPAPISQPTASVEPSAPPPTPVAVVAELRDGGAVLSLDQEGKLTGADALPPAYQNLVKKALSTERIERSSQLQGLTRPPSALMGANDQAKEFSVLEPAGNVLLSNRPAFRWSALEGATAYVVEVYDEQFQLVASSPQLTNRSWTITQPLVRGKIYSWQVKASTDGAEVTTPRPPAPQAKFRVLDEAKTNELAKARRAYGSSHLTLGLLYAEAGLLKEAEQQFLLLRRANPDSELARRFHRQTQALMVRQ